MKNLLLLSQPKIPLFTVPPKSTNYEDHGMSLWMENAYIFHFCRLWKKKENQKDRKFEFWFFLAKNKLALFCTIGTFFLHLHSFDYQPEISPPTLHQEKNMLKNILLFQY